MLNATALLSDELGKRLSSVFLRTFGGIQPHIAAFLDEAARLVIERVGASDALYHDAEHTALVTLVVQDIVRGLRLRRTVSPEDWLHFIVAALYHDFGYLRDVCRGDNGDQQMINAVGETVRLPRGASSKVEPYIGTAITNLELTMEGRQWIAQLYSNVFSLEHHRQHMGPQLAKKSEVLSSTS